MSSYSLFDFVDVAEDSVPLAWNLRAVVRPCFHLLRRPNPHCSPPDLCVRERLHTTRCQSLGWMWVYHALSALKVEMVALTY